MICFQQLFTLVFKKANFQGNLTFWPYYIKANRVASELTMIREGWWWSQKVGCMVSFPVSPYQGKGWDSSLPDEAPGERGPPCPRISRPVLSSLNVGEFWFGLLCMADICRNLAQIQKMSEIMSAGSFCQRWGLIMVDVSFGDTNVR